MNQQHHITVYDLLFMIFIYGICCSFLLPSIEWIILTYTPFVAVVSMSQILWTNNKYGQIKLIKKSNYCSIKCYLILVIATIMIYVFVKNLNLHPSMLCICLSAMMLFIAKEKLCTVLYEHGILFKGCFVEYKLLKESMVVKNYNSEYEFYVNNKIVVLDKEAYSMVK